MKKINSILENYLSIKEEQKKLAKAEKELKEEILKLGETETKQFELTIAEYERESFQLKKALEVLDRRVLKPFITESICIKINIKRKAV